MRSYDAFAATVSLPSRPGIGGSGFPTCAASTLRLQVAADGVNRLATFRWALSARAGPIPVRIALRQVYVSVVASRCSVEPSWYSTHSVPRHRSSSAPMGSTRVTTPSMSSADATSRSATWFASPLVVAEPSAPNAQHPMQHGPVTWGSDEHDRLRPGSGATADEDQVAGSQRRAHRRARHAHRLPHRTRSGHGDRHDRKRDRVLDHRAQPRSHQ